jgi:hypothetical protein
LKAMTRRQQGKIAEKETEGYGGKKTEITWQS